MPGFIIDVTREVKGNIGQVWGIIASFGAEMLWFPNLEASSLEGYGIGSVRTLYFKEGLWPVVREKLVLCDGAAHHIRWQVYNDEVPGKIFSGIVLKKLDEELTQVYWYSENELPADEEQRNSLQKVVQGLYNVCIDTLASKLGAQVSPEENK